MAPEHRPRLPTILGWVAFALVLIVLGPIGFAVTMLDSRPGGSGADPAGKAVVALLVLGLAAGAGLAVRSVALLIAKLVRGRRG